MNFLENCGRVFVCSRGKKHLKAIFTTDFTQCPGCMLADQRLWIVDGQFQSGDGGRIALITQSHRDVAQVAATLGAFHWIALEFSVERLRGEEKFIS